MVPNIAVSILAGLICGLFLNVFYLSLRHVWPENYFGLSGSVDPVVSRNLLRWGIFRLIPPAITAAAAALTAERAGGYFWLAAGVAIILHVQLLVRAAVTSTRRGRQAAAFQESVVAVVIALLMAGATAVRNIFIPIIPEPHELVSNIWAGFIAAVGAVFLQRVVLLRKEPRDLLSRSFAEIPMHLRVAVFRKARLSGIDPSIPLAVMAAENLQRPSWVRRIERLIPTKLGGTRGIMQQAGARNDLHSIELAFTRNFGPEIAPESPWFVFNQYNPAAEFGDLAWAAYTMLSEEPPHLRSIEQAVGRTVSD